jgi:hypothetical protein
MLMFNIYLLLKLTATTLQTTPNAIFAYVVYWPADPDADVQYLLATEVDCNYSTDYSQCYFCLCSLLTSWPWCWCSISTCFLSLLQRLSWLFQKLFCPCGLLSGGPSCWCSICFQSWQQHLYWLFLKIISQFILLIGSVADVQYLNNIYLFSSFFKYEKFT